MFCKVIRDADKLDIFYLFGVNKDLLEEDECAISDNIKEGFYNNRTLSRLDVKSKSDNVVLILAMIFDLNFDYSFKYLYDMKLIDKILENINNKEKFKPYFDYIKSYIEERQK